MWKVFSPDYRSLAYSGFIGGFTSGRDVMLTMVPVGLQLSEGYYFGCAFN